MNRRAWMERKWLAALLGSTAVWILSHGGYAVADGLIEVDQRVFGMDCAPCAYGVEQGLKGLKGATSVRVSLNRGQAVVRLAPDSEVTLAQVREIIRKNGFTPKDATIQVVGRLARAGDGWTLIVDSRQRYRLSPEASASPAWTAVQRARDGARVRLTGRVPESQDASALYVTEIASADSGASPG